MDLHFEEQDNQSLKRFEKMLKTNSVYFFDTTEFERIIKYYIDSGKTNLAKKAISLGLQQHPNTIGLRLLKAEMLIVEDKHSEAISLLEEVEALEPNNEEVLIQRALLLSKKDQHNEAIDLLKNALDISEEDNIDILSLIGMEYLFLEDFERALLYFKNCVEIDVKDHTNLYNIVYCYDMLEKSQEAIKYLKNYIDKEPYSEVAWHQLGRQYYIIESYIESLKSFDYAILIDEQFVGAYIEKAQVLEELQRYEEAIENYLITTELEDPSSFAFLRIGKNFEELDNKDAAIEYYLKSNEQDPFLDKPLLALANLYYKYGDYQNTLFYINKLIEIDEENPDYWKLYAESNLKITFYNEAAKAFSKCLELGGTSLEIFIELADTYYLLGDYTEAIKVLLEAETYFHGHVDIDYRLSAFYFLINSNSLGEKYLLRALKTNASKYRMFKSMFPSVHNSRIVKSIVLRFQNTGK
jgi:tetratricopeptide (TPR) repeat protein